MALLTVATFCSTAFGDLFGSGNAAFEIEFVTIGDPGNVPDTMGNPNPAGSVDYTYRIGKFVVSELMVESASALGDLDLPVAGRGVNKPGTLGWLDAARFVNWLNTSTGHQPAYKIDSQNNFSVWLPEDPGYDSENLYRNTRAKYVLPEVDEWYKAAYYDPSSGEYFRYATGSNTPPTAVASGTDPNTAVFYPAAAGPADVTQAGGLSPFGTMAQANNIFEWNETAVDLVNGPNDSNRIMRGGSWHSGADNSLRRRGATIHHSYWFSRCECSRALNVKLSHNLLMLFPITGKETIMVRYWKGRKDKKRNSGRPFRRSLSTTRNT